MNLIILFIVLNIINVILQTAKSIATVKCGKGVAAIVNAIAYGLYTIVIIYTNSDIAIWIKVIIVALTNLIGVYIVKLIEEKLRKDKLWKIEFTTKTHTLAIINDLETENISYNFIDCGKHTIFNCYCNSQNESAIVKDIIKTYNAKYFASETKILQSFLSF